MRGTKWLSCSTVVLTHVLLLYFQHARNNLSVTKGKRLLFTSLTRYDQIDISFWIHHAPGVKQPVCHCLTSGCVPVS